MIRSGNSSKTSRKVSLPVVKGELDNIDSRRSGSSNNESSSGGGSSLVLVVLEVVVVAVVAFLELVVAAAIVMEAVFAFVDVEEVLVDVGAKCLKFK